MAPRRCAASPLILLAWLGAGCSDETAGPNQPPVANAGTDRTIEIDRAVVLDGTGSWDPDGDALGYRWRIVAKPRLGRLDLQEPETKEPVFKANQPGVWAVRLKVHDGRTWSKPDVMVIVATRTTVCEEDLDCEDGNECTEDRCEAGSCVHTPVADDTPCTDTSYCTVGENCQAGVCTSGGQRDCSDPDPCTQDSCNEDGDVCQHRTVEIPGAEGLAVQGTCSDGVDNDCDGATDDDDPDCQACDSALDCDDQNPCTADSCDGNHACQHGPVPAGTACADDQYCNGQESCDDSGVCQPGEDPCPGSSCNESTDACEGQGCTTDPDCPPGDVCEPACSPDDNGCVTPPGTMGLSCASPVTLPDVSECTLTLQGGDNTGQADCLSCTASVGITVLDYSDFDDGSGVCDQNGWQLVPDTNHDCPETFDQNCAMSGDRHCSDVFSSICETTTFGQPVLRSDQNTNSGDDEAFRMWKAFDATGLTDLTVCFDFADSGASSDDALLVRTRDSGHAAEEVYCKVNGPVEGLDDRFFRICRPLPDWADGSPDLTIEFLLHSNDGGIVLFLDNIEVFGWGGGCPADTPTVFEDDFAGCDLGAWEQPAGTPRCAGSPFQCGADDLLWVEGPDGSTAETWEIRKTGIDATGLDSHVVLCFDLGGSGTDHPTDFVHAQFDAGAGWQTAWYQDVDFGQDGQCQRVCVDLSRIDPGVNNHPALGIRFTLSSQQSGHVVGVDHVVVQGARNCQVPDAVIALSSPADNGDGTYDFDATDVMGTQMDAKITCQWDPDPFLSLTEPVLFRD